MIQEKQRVDVYTLVTNEIIEQLKRNVIPWQQPWHNNGIPQNMLTRKPYRGINLLLLGMLGYESNYFLTFNQLRSIGASVKKGEKAHIVVFWKPLIKEKKEEDVENVKSSSFILKYYKVFNVIQCLDIPQNYLKKEEEIAFSSIAYCEQIITEMNNCPKITYDFQEAFYSPLEDCINMPKHETFKNSELFYSVLFHELIHSTGHLSRLNRMGVTTSAKFGDKSYSLEELTAEIGACFLTSMCGISSDIFGQSVAYIKGWLEALQNDPKFIFHASGQAQRATDYILNVRDHE